MSGGFAKTAICLLGPTASGKTDLAISLAQALPCEIISVDSAMVYRTMDIGTAKPTRQELEKAPHRLINICEPTDIYSAGNFCEDVKCELGAIQQANHIPLLVGGTMMYFNALQKGMAVLPKADPLVREQISQDATLLGWPEMHARLAKVDPEAAAKIHSQDPQRISRALEVFILTGRPLSSFHEERHQAPLSDYHVINLALVPQDRSWLHERIARRFQQMLEVGLVEEVRQFYEDPRMHVDLPAMRMVGYRQVWGYLAGEYDYHEMVERGVAATRQLAKRQLTWLRSWDDLIVYDPRDPNLLEKVLMSLHH